MKKNLLINNNDILLFKKDDCAQNFCKLKDFINFLLQNGFTHPIKFAFVEEHGQLLSNLTLKENIMLETMTGVLSKPKEYQIENFVKKSENKYLIQLLSECGNLDLLPSKVPLQTQKIVTIINRLLQDTDFLIFDRPETNLSIEILHIFSQALQLLLKQKPQTVLVSSTQQAFWLNHATKVVTRSKQFKFIISPNFQFTCKNELEIDKNFEESHLKFMNL